MIRHETILPKILKNFQIDEGFKKRNREIITISNISRLEWPATALQQKKKTYESKYHLKCPNLILNRKANLFIQTK